MKLILLAAAKSSKGVPATGRPYYYHVTPVKNLESIRANGLVPRANQSRFGAASPELLGSSKVPKIFMLPILNGAAHKDFMKEWWHNPDVAVLRAKASDIKGLMVSADPYYARMEAWTFDKIPASVLELQVGNKWVRI